MSADTHDEARRVWHEPGGPVLVEGPVEIVRADGSFERCDRPFVALCACHRSEIFPYCDTSHRRRRPPAASASHRRRQ
jgi:CDGSH-type Zn-finger protein